MNLQYKDLLPKDFPPESRVWIYQCHRIFTLSEALFIEDHLKQFIYQWQSHGDPVKGYANLFFGRFIVLMADESATGVSGCSTDGSVRLIKQLETAMNVQLFDRQLLAFVVKEKIELMPLVQLVHAVKNGLIQPETLYFNNTILTKKELESGWIIPIKDSWLAKKVQFDTLPMS
ncbi:MAG: hypothetical protein ACHQEM_06115 [Chitinophagales bacterium]